jgi:hypothetical protein
VITALLMRPYAEDDNYQPAYQGAADGESTRYAATLPLSAALTAANII